MSLRVMFSREKSDPNYRLTWERCGGGDHRIYRGEPVENDSATDYACGEVVSADGGLTLKPVKCSVSETLAREASEWAYEVRKRREAEQRAKRDAEKAEALAVWDDALAEHAVREAPQRAAWREALLQRPAAQRILRAFPNALPGPDGWLYRRRESRYRRPALRPGRALSDAGAHSSLAPARRSRRSWRGSDTGGPTRPAREGR
jgi:hypothetical protein